MQTWVEVIALVLSPAVAVIIGEILRRRQDEYRTKLWVFTTLLATRHSLFADDRLRAMNLIESVFVKSPTVRDKFNDYLVALTGTDLSKPDVMADANRKLQLLVEAMAKELRLGVSGVDYSRAYSPRALGHAQANEFATAQLSRAMLFNYRKAIGYTDDRARFGLVDKIDLPVSPPPPTM